MPTPYELYQAAISSGKFLTDQYQEEAILQLDELYQELHKKTSLSLKRIFYNSNKYPSKNFYLWGKVGRGKTWLMDLFFNSLQMREKKREHFHAFMRDIHEALKSRQGQKEPLIQIAKDMAKKIKVLCLDEFFVTDIADAMILAKLLDAFFKTNIMVIITSNSHPDNLYPNGLQRSQFLRAIKLIHHHMQIFELKSQEDYRYKTLDAKNLFHYPPNDDEIKKMFVQLAPSPSLIAYHQNIYLYDRPLLTKAHANNIIWFDFYTLCSPPRSQKDYLLLTEKYDIIIVDKVPRISEKDFNTVKYFIYLIDILYDAKTILILNLSVPLSEIYLTDSKHFLHQEFERTLSRLNEMQSFQYIKKCKEVHSLKRGSHDDSPKHI